jgi:hypothetical protein
MFPILHTLTFVGLISAEWLTTDNAALVLAATCRSTQIMLPEGTSQLTPGKFSINHYPSVDLLTMYVQLSASSSMVVSNAALS